MNWGRCWWRDEVIPFWMVSSSHTNTSKPSQVSNSALYCWRIIIMSDISLLCLLYINCELFSCDDDDVNKNYILLIIAIIQIHCWIIKRYALHQNQNTHFCTHNTNTKTYITAFCFWLLFSWLLNKIISLLFAFRFLFGFLVCIMV